MDKARELAQFICAKYERVPVLVRRGMYSGKEMVLFEGKEDIKSFLSHPSLAKVSDTHYVGHAFEYTIKFVLRRKK